MDLDINLNVKEIAKAINGEIIGEINNNINNIIIDNIVTDSREAKAGSLFFALKGENFDGHNFIINAVENGAVCLIVDKNYINDKENGRLTIAPTGEFIIIAVEDTSQALLDLAGYYKGLFNLDYIIGVTGSVGKTTVKEFIYSVVLENFNARKSEGNFNNEVGMPKTIFGLKQNESVLVLEMGMNHFGEIERLTKIAKPNIAVINNIGTAHIENLGSREGIKKAKLEILEGLSKDKVLILNGDEKLLFEERESLKERVNRLIYFGIENSNVDYLAENIRFDYKNNESYFEVNNFGYKINAVGLHNVLNALPAIIIGEICGLNNLEIQAGLNNFKNAKMRQNIYEKNGIIIIDDCYNASLESIKAGLEVLSNINVDLSNGLNKLNNMKKIAVLADILECGNFADELHEQIGVEIIKNNIDKVFVYGESSRKIKEVVKDKCEWFEDKNMIANRLKKYIEKYENNAAVLFKASRGMEIESVLKDFVDLLG